MIKNVRHFGIVVTDMDNSLKFYRDFLDLKIERELHESGNFLDKILNKKDVKVHTIKMSAKEGDTLVELLKFESEQKKPLDNFEVSNIGASHVAFTVENLDETYEKLTSFGVKFNSPPQISSDGYAKVTFCYDPDGVPIELVEVLDPEIAKK